MRLLEYHAKKVLNDLNIPNSFLVKSEADIESMLNTLSLPVVLKAQVLVGGRGKAGGIKVVSSKKKHCHGVKKSLDAPSKVMRSLLF